MLAVALGNFASFAQRARSMVPVAATLALLVLLVTLLGSTYLGHGRSPYGTCYGANGRAVPCEWIERR